LKRKRHSKALRKSEKMHPARFSRPKSTFLTVPILVAGTNSVSSGNIVGESFFDKYFADFFIPANRPAQANRKFPVQLHFYMLKSKFSLSRHFEYSNEQITYHFWLSQCQM
jgi:hypothetical protein